MCFASYYNYFNPFGEATLTRRNSWKAIYAETKSSTSMLMYFPSCYNHFVIYASVLQRHLASGFSLSLKPRLKDYLGLLYVIFAFFIPVLEIWLIVDWTLQQCWWNHWLTTVNWVRSCICQYFIDVVLCNVVLALDIYSVS